MVRISGGLLLEIGVFLGCVGGSRGVLLKFRSREYGGGYFVFLYIC